MNLSRLKNVLGPFSVLTGLVKPIHNLTESAKIEKKKVSLPIRTKLKSIFQS